MENINWYIDRHRPSPPPLPLLIAIVSISTAFQITNEIEICEQLKIEREKSTRYESIHNNGHIYHWIVCMWHNTTTHSHSMHSNIETNQFHSRSLAFHNVSNRLIFYAITFAIPSYVVKWNFHLASLEYVWVLSEYMWFCMSIYRCLARLKVVFFAIWFIFSATSFHMTWMEWRKNALQP